jgi:hypothetical protein
MLHTHAINNDLELELKLHPETYQYLPTHLSAVPTMHTAQEYGVHLILSLGVLHSFRDEKQDTYSKDIFYATSQGCKNILKALNTLEVRSQRVTPNYLNTNRLHTM